MSHVPKIALFFVACLSVSIVRGQSEAVSMEGTVFDASGAPILGADVILYSDERVLTTKANEHGIFQFASLPSGIRYIEASSPGFKSESIPITDKPIERVSFTLWPGQGGGVTPMCLPLQRRMAMPPASAAYEERRDNVQLTGTVSEPSDLPTPRASLTLLRADPDVLLATAQNSNGDVPMKGRPFKENIIATASSDEKGEFRFGDLEPGRYALKVTREGYSNGYVRFWIARKNLTKLSRLYLLSLANEPYCQCPKPTDQARSHFYEIGIRCRILFSSSGKSGLLRHYPTSETGERTSSSC